MDSANPAIPNQTPDTPGENSLPGRWSAQRKMDLALRLLRGEAAGHRGPRRDAGRGGVTMLIPYSLSRKSGSVQGHAMDLLE